MEQILKQIKIYQDPSYSALYREDALKKAIEISTPMIRESIRELAPSMDYGDMYSAGIIGTIRGCTYFKGHNAYDALAFLKTTINLAINERKLDYVKQK